MRLKSYGLFFLAENVWRWGYRSSLVEPEHILLFTVVNINYYLSRQKRNLNGARNSDLCWNNTETTTETTMTSSVSKNLDFVIGS